MLSDRERSRYAPGGSKTAPPPQFGGCLALRVALAAPELVQRMVLVNPATCFARSLGGLAGAIAATNLLSLFPAPLYEVRADEVAASMAAAARAAGVTALYFTKLHYISPATMALQSLAMGFCGSRRHH